MMKMTRAILAAALAWLVCAGPALGANVPFSTYVLGLAAASSITGTEKLVGVQGGVPKTMTPAQIMSAMNGDCSIASPPTIICTKTNGSNFAASATTDTTNANNISAGTLAAARGGAGAINGALKGNGSGGVSQANCASLSDASASCATDATNATNIGAGTLNTARLPAPFANGTRQGNTLAYLTFAGSGPTAGHIATFDANGNLQDGGAAPGTVTSAVIAGTAGDITASGTCTITTTGTCTLDLAAGRKTLPTISTTDGSATTGTGFTSGTTYTTPANVLWIEVLMVGGGGGGSGASTNGSNGGDTCWNTSGTACTSPVYDAGGGTGSAGAGAAGAGGTLSGSGTCGSAIRGGYGQPSASVAAAGGHGAASIFGQGGSGGVGGGNNSGGSGFAYGSGGGGAAQTGASLQSGGSGAACYFIINSPAATYKYAVGAAGTGGTGSPAGGGGAGGYIRVIEHYGS